MALTPLTTDGAATPALQQKGRQKLALRPSYFIGSGGTGHLILLYLKAIFLDLFGHLPPWARIVVFDTDEEDLRYSAGEQHIALERGNEFHYIGNVPVADIIQHIQNHPSIMERLPQITSLPPVALLAGASQLRPLGLLALLWHIDTVVKALNDPLWELAHSDNLGTVDGMRIDAARGINIFVVNSLPGGTGSGQFLDLAYLIRSLLGELGNLANSSEISGLGVLPDAFRNVQGPGLIPNTVAALHELDHCMVQGGFTATYRNDYVADTPQPPFNIYYLLSAVNEDSRTRLSHPALCWMAAMGLYHLAMSPIGKQRNSIIANLNQVLTGRTDGGNGTFFASFGLAELNFPADDVATWCTYHHARALTQQELLSSPDEDDIQRATETVFQTHELRIDALLQRLAVDDTDIPLAADLHAPAHIRDAEPHAVPQLAMNYVQTYRRERVDGDYRVWVRENTRRLQGELQKALSTFMQTAMDDPARGPRFAFTFAQEIEKCLADLATTLGARLKALQAEHSDLEAQMERALTDLMHAPETNWFFRRQTVQKALDQYLKLAQALLQAQFDLTVLEQAITVLVGAQDLAGSWARKIDTLLNRLHAVDDELRQRLGHLTDSLLAPARASGLALINETYLNHLYRSHAPLVSATLDTLLAIPSWAPHHWIDWSREELQAVLVHAAARPFDPIQKMSIEQVIQERTDHMTSRQWVDMLRQKARSAWNLNEALLPERTAHLARIELLGVPNRERSIYAYDAARLVGTEDPYRITAFATTAGAPLTALRRYPHYLRDYERARGRNPLHVLPDFLADSQSARLSFALGHLFRFITNRGVFYRYQPADELTEPIQLGRGRENTIQTLSRQDGLVHEVMQRVEAYIEDVGFDQAEHEMAAFCAPARNDDDLTRDLKRLVRDYAEQLREHRLI